MDSQSNKQYHFWFGAAVVMLFIGSLLAVAVTVIGVQITLPPVVESFKDPTHMIVIPGETELQLSRAGAYAVYSTHYRHPSEFAERPPRLDCRVTSKGTGAIIPVVANYIPTELRVGNRYLGAQIYSTTIKTPGSYSFSCQYPSGQMGSRITLAVGPNYVWEFLRGVWGFASSMLGGLATLCGASLLAMVAVGIALIQRSTRRKSLAVAT